MLKSLNPKQGIIKKKEKFFTMILRTTFKSCKIL